MRVLLASALCTLTLATEALAQPSAGAYGRLPAIGDVAISPDGRRLALAVGFEYRYAEPGRDLTAFRIINIDTGAVEQTLGPPERNIFRGVGWADDQRPYYTISAIVRANQVVPYQTMFRGYQMEYWRIGVLTLTNGQSRILMERSSSSWANISLASLAAPIEGDPGFGRIIAWGGVGAMTNNDPRLTVFRVNLDTGQATPAFAASNMQTRGYILSERGEVVAHVELNEQSNRWRLFSHLDGRPRLIAEDVAENGENLRLYGQLADGRIAAVDPHSYGERDTLLAIDPHTGERSQLYSTGGSDVTVERDPWLRRVIGVSWIADLPKQHFFDEQLQTIYDAVQPPFEDGFAKLESWSRDRGRVVVYGEHADDAGAYYVYEPATHRLRLIGKLYPDLTAPEDFGTRQSITYRARDHTPIPAYLTLPAGVEAHNLPLVLLVHGGPHARDTFTFDWWASFLASRGYAVLQANYRGSTGYGYEWFNAGRGGWGDGVMQHDVEDGVDALVRNGIADPHRVCIVGASYGGYAALAGATITPDRYACAVAVAGVSDPVRMLNDAESGVYGSRDQAAEWWRSSMGDDMDHLRRVTPVDHAAAVHIPMLILHGQQDTVVPFEQSQNMVNHLRGAHKDVQFVTLEGDDHWLSSAPTRTLMLREIETFLAAHIGAGGAPKAN